MHLKLLPFMLLSTVLFFGCETSTEDLDRTSEVEGPTEISTKTFTSEELGIEFQYPSEWELSGGVELNTDCFTEGVKGNIVNINLLLPTQGAFFIEGVDKEACANRGLGAYHYAANPSELGYDSAGSQRLLYEETIELGGNTFYLDFGKVNPGVHAFHAVLFGDLKVVPSLHFYYNPEILDAQKEYVGTEEEYVKEKEVFMEVLSSLTVDTDPAPSTESAIQGTVTGGTPTPIETSEDFFPVEAAEGFVILKQITSNQGEEVVYAELSDCVRNASNYATLLEDGGVMGKPCEAWEYHLQVQNQATGEKTLIYQYPEPTSFSFIPRAEAGGCRMMYMPKAWSPNDKKIIVDLFNPTSCGSGMSSSYIYSTVSPEGGDFEELASYDALFTSDYSHVVYTANSETSPRGCAPDGGSNHGKILLQNIESGEEKALREEPTTYYDLEELSTDNKTLSYKARKSEPDEIGCAKHESFQEKSLTLPL